MKLQSPHNAQLAMAVEAFNKAVGKAQELINVHRDVQVGKITITQSRTCPSMNVEGGATPNVPVAYCNIELKLNVNASFTEQDLRYI